MKVNIYVIIVSMMLFPNCSKNRQANGNVLDEALENVPVMIKRFFPSELDTLYHANGTLTSEMQRLSFIYYGFYLTSSHREKIKQTIHNLKPLTSEDSIFVLKDSAYFFDKKEKRPCQIVPYFTFRFSDDDVISKDILSNNNIFSKTSTTGLDDSFVFYNLECLYFEDITDPELKRYILSAKKHRGIVIGIAISPKYDVAIYYYEIF